MSKKKKLNIRSIDDKTTSGPTMTPEMVINTNIRNEIVQYYNKEYVKQLNLQKFQRLNEYALKSDLIIAMSSRNRLVVSTQIMKYNYRHNKTGNICTVFKATTSEGTVTYSYVYSQYNPHNKDPTTHKYFCCGGSFKSQDGEFRDRLLIWSRFNDIKIAYGYVMEKVEKLVVDKISNGSLALSASFFYPSNFADSERKFENYVNENRIAIDLFVLCWLRDYHMIYVGAIENHINPLYRNIIYNTEDHSMYKSIIDSIGLNSYEEMISVLTILFSNINRHQFFKEIQCGQKIFPMTAFEAIKIDDINFNIWREIYISNLCSNLVMNFISPSFPFINNWFYIENANEDLFDNTAMHEKYLHSKIAESISDQLREIDKLNYIERKREHGPINSRFMRLSKRIQKSIIYADSAIKLTDLAVCVTSEYVGRTFRDIPSLILSAPLLEYERLLSNIDIFNKHVFEFIYSIYCMNTKIGIIHGDLHMNNVTVFHLYLLKTNPTYANLKSSKIVYILRDTMYVFPHYGFFSCIIDFSRSIIGDKAMLIDEYGDKYADMYFKEQRLRMMRLLFQYFPKFMERYHSEIEKLIVSDFELCFKIMTAIDTYVLCINLNTMLSVDQHIKSGLVKLHPDIPKNLNKIIIMAENLIMENFKQVINGEIKTSKDIEWPNYVLIKKYYEKYETNDADIKLDDIVDIFNENNDVKYSVEDYDTYSPLLSLSGEEKIYKKYGKEMPGLSVWMDFKTQTEGRDLERLLDKYEQQEKDVINIEPWMLY